MKTKNLIVAFVVAILSLALNAKGNLQIPPEFPMGSPDVVTNYCVRKVALVSVDFYKVVTNNNVWLDGTSVNRTFNSKAELDAVAQDLTRQVVNRFGATNKNNSGLYRVIVNAHSGAPFATMLSADYKFGFAGFIPMTFSDLLTQIQNLIPYSVPGIRQAIIQSTSPYGPEDTIIRDSRVVADQKEIVLNQDPNFGTLSLPIYLVIASDRTNNLTVSTSLNGVKLFKVYDREGSLRPETLPVMTSVTNKTVIKISLSGGEAGRVYKVQMTTNTTTGVGAWANGSYAFPFTGGYSGWRTNISFPITNNIPGCIFRVVGLATWLP